MALVLLLAGLAYSVAGPRTARAEDAGKPRPIPVILATDIGDDIDDTWALGLLLKCPELDVKLVVGDYGKAEYRAKLIAKMLETAGRTDVAVGVGLPIDPKGAGPQADWVKDYDLDRYPGKVHRDGVQAMIDMIMASDRPMTLIAIGPLPNVAEALRREPRIAQRARFVGMHGSVRRGYHGGDKPSAEWNVRCDAEACRAVFTAAWDMTITPLDTCGVVDLFGEQYAVVRDSKDPIAAAIIENYRMWSQDKRRAEERSSTLFDTVAIYLALRHDWCKMESLGIRVTDDGMTVIDESAKRIEVATEWKDLPAFRAWLVERLTGGAK